MKFHPFLLAGIPEATGKNTSNWSPPFLWRGSVHGHASDHLLHKGHALFNGHHFFLGLNGGQGSQGLGSKIVGEKVEKSSEKAICKYEPLVNVHISMENYHLEWEDLIFPLGHFQYMLNIQRVPSFSSGHCQ